MVALLHLILGVARSSKNLQRKVWQITSQQRNLCLCRDPFALCIQGHSPVSVQGSRKGPRNKEFLKQGVGTAPLQASFRVAHVLVFWVKLSFARSTLHSTSTPRQARNSRR